MANDNYQTYEGEIAYVDNAFGGTAGGYANGTVIGDVLSIDLGGIDNADITDISG